MSRSSSAQTPQLIFTAPLPEQTQPDHGVQSSPVVEERGLALWAGTATDFGSGVTVSANPRWALRGISAMTTTRIDDRERQSFYQFEVLRPVFAIRSLSVAGGGGVRQNWDGAPVFIGRLIGGSDLAHGRLQCSLVVERALSPSVAHDAADFLTTIGWSKPIGNRTGLGIGAVGQDLEGLWNAAEADGGAKLVVGPSLHLRGDGAWSASVTAGPVVQTFSTIAPASAGGRHFAVFAAGTWMPALHR